MSDPSPASPSRSWDSDRVETFSDGVFAIAITLLVLDIHVPSDLHGLRHALEHEWPAYLAYATSFLTIGGVWFTHHSIYSTLRYVDRPLLRINLFLLMATAFLPFPTGILAEALRAPHEAAQTAVVLYGLTALVIELLLLASMRRAESRPELHTDETRELRERAGEPKARTRVRATISLYVVAIVLGILELPEIATVAYLSLAAVSVLVAGGDGPVPRQSGGRGTA